MWSHSSCFTSVSSFGFNLLQCEQLFIIMTKKTQICSCRQHECIHIVYYLLLWNLAFSVTCYFMKSCALILKSCSFFHTNILPHICTLYQHISPPGAAQYNQYGTGGLVRALYLCVEWRVFSPPPSCLSCPLTRTNNLQVTALFRCVFTMPWWWRCPFWSLSFDCVVFLWCLLFFMVQNFVICCFLNKFGLDWVSVKEVTASPVCIWLALPGHVPEGCSVTTNT